MGSATYEQVVAKPKLRWSPDVLGRELDHTATVLHEYLSAIDQFDQEVPLASIDGWDPLSFPIEIRTKVEVAPICHRKSSALQVIRAKDFCSAYKNHNYTCCEVCLPADYKKGEGSCRHICGAVVG